jgi:hypothetical protein
MSHASTQTLLNAIPAKEWDEFDLSDLLKESDKDDWALLKLVACIAVATLVIALTVSLT